MLQYNPSCQVTHLSKFQLKGIQHLTLCCFVDVACMFVIACLCLLGVRQRNGCTVSSSWVSPFLLGRCHSCLGWYNHCLDLLLLLELYNLLQGSRFPFLFKVSDVVPFNRTKGSDFFEAADLSFETEPLVHQPYSTHTCNTISKQASFLLPRCRLSSFSACSLMSVFRWLLV